MNHMKCWLCCCTFLAAVLLTGCRSGKTHIPKVWNVASIQTETHPQTLAVKKMGEIFSELTGGKYKIEVFPNELLGPQRETLEQVQYGIIEMAVMGNPNVSSFEQGFLTFEMPFLFDDLEHQKIFFETSPVVPVLFKSTDKYNFTILTYFTAGTRNIYAKKPVRNLADLKGMKIRTAESDTYAKMMSALGGAATPMSFGEVFTAIQSGVVDGAENNEASYANTKHYEIAPYYSLTKHLIVPDYLVINTKLYEALPEEDRQALQEAVRQALIYEVELWQQDAAERLEQVKKGGATIVEDVDTLQLQKAVEGLHKELTQNPKIKEVYDAVKATSKLK